MRPRGQSWRNWKKGEVRRLVRAGLPLPIDWGSHWDATHGVVEYDHVPSPDVPAEVLIERLKDDYKRKSAYEEARKRLHVKVPSQKAYGILFFGDPHLDDPGTDWFALERDIAIVRENTDIYAANIGDTLNNWVGKLLRLDGEQSITKRQGWTLAKWFFGKLSGKWLYIISGNHDLFSGDRDPLEYIAERVGVKYEACDARLAVRSEVGPDLLINTRHGFKGGSMWNPAHGVAREAQLGIRDHLIVGGHTHSSGYGVFKNPENGHLIHCLQLASYKTYDMYARTGQFRDANISPSALVVVDPSQCGGVGHLTVFFDTTKGALFLRALNRDSDKNIG